jgi:hypothetical protein
MLNDAASGRKQGTASTLDVLNSCAPGLLPAPWAVDYNQKEGPPSGFPCTLTKGSDDAKQYKFANRKNRLRTGFASLAGDRIIVHYPAGMRQSSGSPCRVLFSLRFAAGLAG